MKREQLYTLFGEIDEELVEQAEAYTPPARKRRAFWLAPIAACAAVAVGLTILLPRLTGRDAPPFQGATYSSLEDIPVEGAGNGDANGPVQLWESGGHLYFSYTTRLVRNTEKQTTTTYETVFRVNTQDGSYTAVSEEARAIALRDGRFIYTRSDEHLTIYNLWTVPYYTNSLQWNDERPISGKQAMEQMSKRYGSLEGQPVRSVEVNGDTVRVETENGRNYCIRIPFEEVWKLNGTASLRFGHLVGFSRNKMYFVGAYEKDSVYGEALFVIGVDGKGLKEVSCDAATGVIGWDAHLDADGHLWFFYTPNWSMDGENSFIVRLDTRTDEIKEIAQVAGRVESFVRNDSHILCIVANDLGRRADLVLVPY